MFNMNMANGVERLEVSVNGSLVGIGLYANALNPKRPPVIATKVVGVEDTLEQFVYGQGMSRAIAGMNEIAGRVGDLNPVQPVLIGMVEIAVEVNAQELKQAKEWEPKGGVTQETLAKYLQSKGWTCYKRKPKPKVV